MCWLMPSCVSIHLSKVVAAAVVVSAVLRSPLPRVVPGARRTPEVKVRLYKVSLSLIIGVPGLRVMTTFPASLLLTSLRLTLASSQRVLKVQRPRELVPKCFEVLERLSSVDLART